MNQSSPASTEPEELPAELTPEEIRDAFRRYHLIIAGFVVLMAFFAASFISSAPDLWRRLATGRQIVERFPTFPVTSDFSYTAPEGQPAPNPSWLYDVGSYLVFQGGDIVLVGTKVLLVVLTSLILLSIRRPGPTLGWHAFCVALALVAMSSRLDLGPTVVSYLLLALLLWFWNRSTTTGNPRWIYGAVPVLILWANIDFLFPLGGAITLAILLGQVVGGGRSAKGTPTAKKPVARPSLTPYLITAVVGILAGLISPFGYRNLIFPFSLITPFGKPISDFPYVSFSTLGRLPSLDVGGEGWSSVLELIGQGEWAPPIIGWYVLLLLAVISFVVNTSRFNLTRLLLTLIAIGLVIFERWLGASGIILAIVASLNAQDFYLSRYGTTVRTSFGALLISQLSVIGIILAVFAGMLGMLTGRIQGHIAQFGFTIDRPLFAERTAEWLATSGLEERAFTIAPAQRVSNYLIWADPKRKSFIDLRWPDEKKTWLEYDRTRFSLTGLDPEHNDPNAWKETFRKYGISYIVVDMRDESQVMRTVRLQLSLRSDIAPIHVDDQCVIYGWLTDSIKDYAKIKSLRLQTNALAFRDKRDPPPPTDRPVTPPGVIDMIWPIRWVEKPAGLFKGTFFSGGGHWLSPPGTNVLAASYLREAVSNAPDSPDANLRLGVALLGICQQELMVMAAQPKTAAIVGPARPQDPAPTAKPGEAADPSAKQETTAPQPSKIERMAPSEIILTRHHQTMAALQAALTAGANNMGVHKAIGDFARMNSFYDLWLQQLEEQRPFAEDPKQRALIDAEIQYVRPEVQRRLALYKKAIKDRSQELIEQGDKIDAELTKVADKIKSAKDEQRALLEQQQEYFRRQAETLRAMAGVDRPFENSQIAFSYDMPLLAVAEIEKISAQSAEAGAAAEFAARLYLRMGMPEKAMARLNQLKSSEASNQLGPGVYLWLLAQIQITSGQFAEARNSLERAIYEVRERAAMTSLNNVEARVRMGLMATRGGSPAITEARGIVSERSFEASFTYDLAIVHIELAESERAAADFRSVIKLVPDFQLEPIMEFYYQQITGQSLPQPPAHSLDEEIAVRFPPKDPTAAEPQAPTAPATTPTTPVEPTPPKEPPAAPVTPPSNETPPPGPPATTPATEAKPPAEAPK